MQGSCLEVGLRDEAWRERRLGYDQTDVTDRFAPPGPP